jgi:uncharacterized membrane protein YphA (DoxX/SURF4 family)
MNSSDAGAGPFRIASFGHAAFAAALIALGVMGLVQAGATPIWTGVPKSLPARAALIGLCAVLSLGSGLGLLWRRTAAVAARVLLTSFVLWMPLFRLPLLFRSPTSSGVWWACGETAVMMAGAWVLVVGLTGDRDGRQPGLVTGERGIAIARVLYGLGLIPFGIGHFTYLERTVGMVPRWLPWPLGWAYFTGGAFIAAGVAVVFGVLARLAATLSAWEMTLFTVLVWIPGIVAGGDASQWSEFVDSCALTAVGWLVAETYRGSRWLESPLPARGQR